MAPSSTDAACWSASDADIVGMRSTPVSAKVRYRGLRCAHALILTSSEDRVDQFHTHRSLSLGRHSYDKRRLTHSAARCDDDVPFHGFILQITHIANDGVQKEEVA